MRASAALSLSPRVRERLWARAADPFDRRFLAGIFARIPSHISGRLLTEWETRRDRDGQREANLYALNLKHALLPELFHETALPFDASDDAIADAAEKVALHVRGRVAMLQAAGEQRLREALTRVVKRYGVGMPHAKTLPGVIARMTDKAWWRRALRKRFQVVEHAAIRAGCVHRRAAPYVSDEAYRRHERHARKTAALLAGLEAMNEATGEVLSLAELRDTSTANPAIRRYAMMACLRGLEERAKALSFEAVFLTITCPSRMHARLSVSGESNTSYDTTSPREAQRYLARQVWNKAMRKLAHDGIQPGRDYFGLRTVEPHHDATPHWHVLVFVRPAVKERFVSVLHAYALADSSDEPGAKLRRFTVTDIDPAKGSAVGYIAKYISKNTDGAEVGEDHEADGGATGNAPRVVAWARLWNARQFQFFGVGAVSPFRELYRLDAIPQSLESLLGALWQAARDGDFAAYLEAREARQTRLTMLYEVEESKRYPGEHARRLRGVQVAGDAGPVPIITRPDSWVIRFREKPGFALPWTRFNNSARPDLTGVSERKQGSGTRAHQGENTGLDGKQGWKGRSRPEPGTATQSGAAVRQGTGSIAHGRERARTVFGTP